MNAWAMEHPILTFLLVLALIEACTPKSKGGDE